MLSEQIKKAFDPIRADEALKQKTISGVKAQMNERCKPQSNLLKVLPAAACFVLLMVGSIKLYFTPTAMVSIDINPSIELSVNRFDRVINASALNDDGIAVLDSVQLNNTDINDAVEQVMNTDIIKTLLSGDEIMEINVAGEKDVQKTRIYSVLSENTQQQDHVTCCCIDSTDAEKARELGMSYGKYKRYIQLVENGFDLTPEQVQNMTMHELKALTDTFHDNGENKSDSVDHREQYRQHGKNKNSD